MDGTLEPFDRSRLEEIKAADPAAVILNGYYCGHLGEDTVDELEAKVKAGEQISLVDLAEAIKADKERGKEKPSIRAQLKADKERAGKKKPTKQKSQDLERS